MEIYAVFGLNADQNLRIRLILRSVISFEYLMDLSFAGRPSEISSFRLPVCNTVFSGLTQYFCLIFCMKLEISKKIKVTKTTFWKRDICGPEISTFKVFSKSVNQVVLKLYLMACIKRWFFKENSYHAGKRAFLMLELGIHCYFVIVSFFERQGRKQRIKFYFLNKKKCIK